MNANGTVLYSCPLLAPPTVVDQTYNPESENAQSGKAVAEALEDKADRDVLSTEIEYVLAVKQDKLTAGDNVNIDSDNVISVTVDQTYTSTSENPQSGKAVAEAISDKANLETINFAEPPQIEVVEIEGDADLKDGFYRVSMVADEGIVQFVSDENLDNRVVVRFVNKLAALKYGVLVYILWYVSPSGAISFLDFTIFKDVADKQDKFAEVLTEEKDEVNGIALTKPMATVRATNGGLSLEGYTLALNSTMSDSIYCNNKKLQAVADPEYENEAANKGYVDTKIGDIETALDEIIALQESILGGE